VKEDSLHSTITETWWALALRGIAALLFGLACFLLTGIALIALVALFAAYLLVDGIFAIIAGARSRSWLLALEGVLGIVAGGLAFFYPGITALVLALIIAAWAFVTGLIEIGAAISLRQIVRNEWVLAASGVLSILFAVLMVIFPGAGLVAIVWLIGGYSIVWGALLLGLAFRLRGRRRATMVAA
jgi:uncharacterized membrane protein HdeD (DUF308 family)